MRGQPNIYLFFVRFYQRIHKTKNCWWWTGVKNHHNYGVMERDGKIIRVHRFMWWLMNGQIPTGLNICHTCDNPSCVRPDHLFIGTQADNNTDRDRKGRARYISQAGEMNGQAKLADFEVDEVRVRLQQGNLQKDIALTYGVCQQTISNIKLGARRAKTNHHSM